MLAPATAITRAKSPEAFRTISEVALDLDVPQHVLRFWESRFAQVRPIKRAGGRRYYRPEDVDLLRGIRSLLYSEGYTIKGVQKVMRDRGLRYVAQFGRGTSSYDGPASIGAEDKLGFDRPSFDAPLVIEENDEQPPAVSASSLAEEERVKLEILLAELLQLKTRLRTALTRSQSLI
jgi:DNA-binding transcriptional MerR regulator